MVGQEVPKSLGLSSLTLPDNHRPPPHPLKILDCSTVTLDVRLKLSCPEIWPRLGISRQTAARMAVPEAAVHEQRDMQPREHEVRCTREVLPMKAEAQPHGVSSTAYGHLRPRVLPANPRHHLAASLLADYVHNRTLWLIRRSDATRRDRVRPQLTPVRQPIAAAQLCAPRNSHDGCTRPPRP